MSSSSRLLEFTQRWPGLRVELAFRGFVEFDPLSIHVARNVRTPVLASLRGMALQAMAILVNESMAKLSQTVEREKRPAYAPRVFEPSIETPNVPLQRRRQRVDARR